jgi:hypothetical protein
MSEQERQNAAKAKQAAEAFLRKRARFQRVVAQLLPSKIWDTSPQVHAYFAAMNRTTITAARISERERKSPLWDYQDVSFRFCTQRRYPTRKPSSPGSGVTTSRETDLAWRDGAFRAPPEAVPGVDGAWYEVADSQQAHVEFDGGYVSFPMTQELFDPTSRTIYHLVNQSTSFSRD